MTPEQKLSALFAAEAPPARDYSFQARMAQAIALRRAWMTVAALVSAQSCSAKGSTNKPSNCFSLNALAPMIAICRKALTVRSSRGCSVRRPK